MTLINLSLSNPIHHKDILVLRIVSAPHFLIVFLHQVRKLSASGSPAEDPLKERITLDVRITLLRHHVAEWCNLQNIYERGLIEKMGLAG
jgi:hypothetical protein